MKSYNYITTSFNTTQERSTFLDSDMYKMQSSNLRIICKKMLYLIGIPYEIANEETLIKKEYLGQYGSIQKIIINKNGYLKNESNYPTYSSYITYSSEIEASLALLALNNSLVSNHKLNACYGTNKYCNSFLKGIECTNKDCYYLHETADINDIIMKNNSQMKLQFLEQQKIATKIANIYSKEQKEIYIKQGTDLKKEFQENNIPNFFPTIDTIYEKKFVQDFENEKLGIIPDINNSTEYNITNKKNKKDYIFNPSSPKFEYSRKAKIKSTYNSPDVKDIENNIAEEDEDDEYILVRQPSKPKKKFSGYKNSYRHHHYKKEHYKLKYTLEKYRIKYNIKYEEKSSSPSKESKNCSNPTSNEKPKLIYSDTSVNSNNISGYNTNESSTQNNQPEDDNKKCALKKTNRSRFSFANNDENIEQSNIFIMPDFVKEILDKKFWTLSFTNFLRGENRSNLDEYYFEKALLSDEIQIIKKWIEAE